MLSCPPTTIDCDQIQAVADAANAQDELQISIKRSSMTADVATTNLESLREILRH